MPTMALANSISFTQMKDAGKEFPAVRVFGTMGWIAAGFLMERYATTINSVLSYQWQLVWLMPAMIAGVVLVAFAALFSDKINKAEKS